MPRQRKSSRQLSSLPSLFDFPGAMPEETDGNFEFIPSEEMEKIRRTLEPEAAAPEIDELEPMEASDLTFFMSFGSGSSGNCAYIGSRREGFLIDAGVDSKTVIDALTANGIPMKAVKGILLTHDHSDHIRSVYALVRRHTHMRIYCTPKVLNGILRRHSISRRIKDYHTPIYKEFPFKIGAFEVTAFEVMHDGTDNAGFFIRHGKEAIAVATDLGCISERVDHYMRLASHIVLEANYDLEMLRNGRYPEYLKARIEAANGHLDNTMTAAFLAGIYTPALRNVFLCHLSHDNNTPSKALTAVRDALEKAGVKEFRGEEPALPDSTEGTMALTLVALPRFEPTRLFALRCR